MIFLPMPRPWWPGGYGNRLEQDIAASGFKTAETTDRSVLGCNKEYPPDRFDVMTPRQM